MSKYIDLENRIYEDTDPNGTKTVGTGKEATK